AIARLPRLNFIIVANLGFRFAPPQALRYSHAPRATELSHHELDQTFLRFIGHSMANKILLIEDDSGITMALTDLLNAEDYRVETAADGLTGLARAREGNFDVIILDVMLPGKNGFDVCRDLRQRSITTPILMLTARGQVIDKVLGLKLGADDYLCKPFEPLELLARLEAL